MPLSSTELALQNPSRAQTQLILGRLEHIENGAIQGWAIDRLNPQIPLQLRLSIDGNLAAVLDCNIERPDLAALNLPSHAAGFDFRIPRRFHDGIRHVLALASLQGCPVQLPNAENRLLSEIHFSIASCQHVDGVLDGLVDGMIQGWALKTDPQTGQKTGGLRLLISANGQPIAEVTADQFRADVAASGNADSCCGFSHPLPPEFTLQTSIRLEVHAMPGRLPLRYSPSEVFLPAPSERGRILALIERADSLFRFAHDLRKQLREALPVERYSLNHYEAWARQNRDKIALRAAARYGEIKGRPLVSILCPVYRPELAAFLAAIDSVRAQTYEDWELILVDDGSSDAVLQRTIAALARHDSRIRGFAQPQNTGISSATNRALAEAKGEVSIFFDHDDVLDPNALAVMLRARSATGARLLYSDEDKINSAGRFSEPNLKPDFNYRLLLELNYICHLVMVETALARETLLNPRFDGAQDHDFLLRLTERIPPDAIHHVPEILYHWRISPNSSASANSAKPDSGRAGAQAIAEHLARRGINAKVTQRGDLTCYRVAFTDTADPGVSILIPFRDHIEMTANGVAAVRALTRGVDYEIILLDNGSTAPEAESFCADQANLPATKVIRIAEPFNFSRINNLGAAAAKHPFLLFLNNDVLVRGEDWLRCLLNEALADPKTAAVGAKLLYPNGTIQHAGVVLGIGGVADHGFRGLPAQAPGYIAQAITAREVAAVTAACMLVRAAAFHEAGGFDEAELGIAFNDIDLCLKLRKAGHRIVFTPECIAEHRESMSRGDDFSESKLARFMHENQVMLERWGHLLPHDPFYNPHFARDGGLYRDLRVLQPCEQASAVSGAAEN